MARCSCCWVRVAVGRRPYFGASLDSSTPTKVPRNTPRAAYIRLVGVKAAWRPPHNNSRLSISEDPVEAARTAVEGRERLLDVAEVDGTPYMGIASFGFDSDANRIANEARLVRGNLVYAYAAFRAMATWKHAGFTVTVDGEPHELSGFSVAVANSRAFGGGMFLAPQAELDDGVLDIVAICGRSKLATSVGCPGSSRASTSTTPW